VADVLSDGDWFLSDSVNCRPIGRDEMGRGRIRELSLVRETANMSTRPVRFSRGDVASGDCGRPSGLPLNWHSTWDRAAEHMASYGYRFNRADRLTIHDLDQLDTVDELLTDPAYAARMRAEAAAVRPKPTPKATFSTRSTPKATASTMRTLEDLTDWDLIDLGLLDA
jgi:hypothetical protein